MIENHDEILSLIARGEGQTLEFKGEFPEQARDLAKEIAAFSTSNGGVILVGVEDDGTVVGLAKADTSVERDLLVRRVEGICINSVKPPVTPGVEFTELDGKRVMVIRVAKGSSPVYSANSIFYLRHITSSRAAEPSELVDLVSRHGALVATPTPFGAQNILPAPATTAPLLTNDANRIAEAEQAIVNLQTSMFTTASQTLVSGPKLAVYVIPMASFDGPNFTLDEVKAVRGLFIPSFASRVLEGTNTQQFWSYDPPRKVGNLPNPESRWSTRLVRPGHLEMVINIGERIDDDRNIAVHGAEIEKDLVEAVDRAAEIAKALRLCGPTVVAASLEGVTDVDILRSRPGGRRIRENSIWLGSIKLEKLEKPSADALRSLMDNIWVAGGWDTGSHYFQDGKWTGYGT